MIENQGSSFVTLFFALIALACYPVAFFALCRIGFYYHPVAGWICVGMCAVYAAREISEAVK